MDATTPGSTSVIDNEAAQRYELVIDGKVCGIADYRLRGDVMVLPHTEIAREMQGRGLGAVLVDGLLDDVRARGRKVVPQCWYVAQRMQERPETQDLLADTAR